MAVDPRKRQKKLQKRAAKRKEKRHSLVREQNAGVFEQQRAFVHCPVLHCTISNGIAEQGLGWVIFSRESASRQVAVNAFLVDAYCLGVKNVIAQIVTRSEYDDYFGRRLRTEMPSRTATLAEARKLLADAVAYASNLGLPPHPDYAKTIPLFGDVNPADCDVQFTFGKDGKPFFFAGPNDSPEKCKRIVSALESTCGPGQFHFTMPISGDELMHHGLPDDADEDDQFADEEHAIEERVA